MLLALESARATAIGAVRLSLGRWTTEAEIDRAAAARGPAARWHTLCDAVGTANLWSRRSKAMMWLKACPRCQGDLFEGVDFDGPVVKCLQCGRSAAGPSQVRSHQALPTRRAHRPATRRFTLSDLGPMMASHQDGGEAWAS